MGSVRSAAATNLRALLDCNADDSSGLCRELLDNVAVWRNEAGKADLDEPLVRLAMAAAAPIIGRRGIPRDILNSPSVEQRESQLGREQVRLRLADASGPGTTSTTDRARPRCKWRRLKHTCWLIAAGIISSV